MNDVPTQAMRRRRAALVAALDAVDRTDARHAVARALHGAGPLECDTCGETIPPDERASAPKAEQCAACRAALALPLLSLRSRFST
jgi:RNA polymerase-binding transcription factor DksA